MVNRLLLIVLVSAASFGAGCGKTPQLASRGPERWKDLPAAWHDPRGLMIVARPGEDGWMYFMPMNSIGFAEMNKLRGASVELQTRLPDDVEMDPPAVRYRGSFMENVSVAQFVDASGDIIGFADGNPIDRARIQVAKTAVTYRNTGDPRDHALLINNHEIDMGYPAVKTARPSPSGQYYAVIWTDAKPRTASLGGQWNFPIYDGEAYIHLIDAQTGQSLGSPVLLEECKGTLGPTVVWTNDSKHVLLSDIQKRRIWIFSVDDLRVLVPNQQSESPTNRATN